MIGYREKVISHLSFLERAQTEKQSKEKINLY